MQGRVLITGATGSIGSAIVRHIVKTRNNSVVVFSRDEFKQHELKQELKDYDVEYIIGDVRSFDSINSAMRGINVCFHTAAMKHVSICEENPFEAVKTNVVGTENLIRAALANGVYRVLAISTDKAVNPISVLGCTKLLMERLLKERNCYSNKLSSIRFGNILGSRGSVLDIWVKQAANGEPITVTVGHPTRYFIEIDEAVKACLKAIDIMRGGETFVVDCGEPKDIYEMAKKVSSNVIITDLRSGERLHEELYTTSERQAKVKMADGLWAV